MSSNLYFYGVMKERSSVQPSGLTDFELWNAWSMEHDAMSTHDELMTEGSIYRDFVTVRSQSKGWSQRARA